jgi:hypothetical protein
MSEDNSDVKDVHKIEDAGVKNVHYMEDVEADEQKQCEQNLFTRTTFLVQLLSIPLPLVCTGQGDYSSGFKDVGNSHDLISTILGRILASHKDRMQETLQYVQKEVLMGDHVTALFTSILKHKEAKQTPPSYHFNAYQALCAYTRIVLERLIALDRSCPASILDIRFVQDVGIISKARHASLVGNALEHAKAMEVLYEMDDTAGGLGATRGMGATVDLRRAATAKGNLDYQDLVIFNINVVEKVALEEM